nr:LysM peptidoglycan-binding domain-containing protein [Staphylococcus epidermidis]
MTVNDLMRANNLNGYLIMPNQTLNIPSGSGNGAGSGGTTVTPSNTNTTPTFNHSNLYTSGNLSNHFITLS